ncbi:MAG: MBL fold metallo-hydrolase, partial [Candidatus Limnocylindrales bacterium]
MDLHVILTPGLGNAAYLLASGREAVAVDPPRDAWRLVAAAEARGWRITHVVETHVHNDYLSGALELRAALGTELVLPARGRYAFEHRGADDGDVLEIDGLRLTARATPGHTPEHLAWEVVDGGVGATAILTGGSLLVGSAGRTDLLGDDQTEALTRAQFHSLRALAGLADDVAVLPTHGAGSFCSAGPPGGERTTTMGTERTTNPFLRIDDEAAFRTALLRGLGPYPTYYREMAAINRVGAAVLGGVSTPPPMSPEAVSAAVGAGGAVIVDARSRAEFAAGHVPASLNIELADSFASYVGWFVAFGAPIVLVLPNPQEAALAEATTQLFRIGYDRIVGVLDSGTEAWVAGGGRLDSYPMTTIAATRDALARGTRLHLLDVRDPLEWRGEGDVPTAIELSLGDLPGRFDSLPRDAPITVMCR